MEEWNVSIKKREYNKREYNKREYIDHQVLRGICHET